MTRSIFRICTIAALGLAGSMLPAQQTPVGLTGVWDVSVTVTNCHGTTIRTVRALQMFRHDGSFIETTNLPSRGISEGVWKPAGDRTFEASYWFFRYPPPEGPFASFAKAKNTIALDSDGDYFTASGTVEDFLTTGTTMTACVTQIGHSLTNSDHDADDSKQ